jgi:hypothetical protein
MKNEIGFEMWKSVFSFLSPNITTFIGLSLVCKAWSLRNTCHLFSIYIKNSDHFQKITSLSNVRRLQINFHRLRNISGNRFVEKEREKLLFYEHCNHFKYVQIGNVRRLDLTSFMNCRGLIIIEASWISLPRNLNWLVLSHCDLSEIGLFSCNLANLQMLCVTYCENFTQNLGYLQFFPNLQFLELCNSDTVNFQSLESCKQLKYLKLGDIQSPYRPCMFGKNILAQLKYLDISLKFVTIELLLQFKKLSKLILHDVEDYDDLSSLNDMQQLEEIILVDCDVDFSNISKKTTHINDEVYTTWLFFAHFKFDTTLFGLW